MFSFNNTLIFHITIHSFIHYIIFLFLFNFHNNVIMKIIHTTFNQELPPTVTIIWIILSSTFLYEFIHNTIFSATFLIQQIYCKLTTILFHIRYYLFYILIILDYHNASSFTTSMHLFILNSSFFPSSLLTFFSFSLANK